MATVNRKAKLFLTLSPFSALALLAFFSLTPDQVKGTESSPLQPDNIHAQQHIQIAKSACEGTLYPDLCLSTVSSFPELRSRTFLEIISSLVNSTVFEARDSETNCTRIRKKFQNLEPLVQRALGDCLELLGYTVAQLRNAITDLSSNSSTVLHYPDLQTLFSGAMTNQATCLDGFAFAKNKFIRKFIEARLRKISRHVSNSLAMLKKIKKPTSSRKLDEVFPEYGTVKEGFPTWLKKKDRALLQAPVTGIKYNSMVAQDGSGDYTTINASLQAAPNSSKSRFVIYIKAGTYYENLDIGSKKTMIMLVGDGIGKTQIKGNRNVVDGWTTFRSATVAVVGERFIARGITFENYAGASKHQAVALRVGADLSAFYQCSFIGYQDTLYVHSLRQFFRDCDIYGTIDFIFGNSAVVFQNCSLYARKPDPNQRNVFTAQGREDPNQNTGISIIGSKIAAGSELIPVLSQFKNYLGRPWKEYSRTVILLTNIEGLIDPAGWLPWSGDFALSTLYYGEYKNRGAGSDTSRRVKWPGYRVITSDSDASQFTVANFILGNAWLPDTGIPFYPNLTP